MNVYMVRDFVGGACELKKRRPKQGVKVDDVLADEVDLLRVGRREEFAETARFAVRFGFAAVEVVLERRQVADGRIEPHIEVLAGSAGDGYAEVGRVARDIPVAEGLIPGTVEPFLGLVRHLRLQPAGLVQPLPKKLDALRIG